MKSKGEGTNHQTIYILSEKNVKRRVRVQVTCKRKERKSSSWKYDGDGGGLPKYMIPKTFNSYLLEIPFSGQNRIETTS
jgi:hypothetical protein